MPVVSNSTGSPRKSEDLETWTPLLGLTRTSNCGSHVSVGTSRLKELQEKLQMRMPESPAPKKTRATWRIHPVSGAIVSNYKKDVNARYHLQSNQYWTSAQRETRSAFHSAVLVEYLTKSRIPEGAIR